jgi:hypothetical protein
MPGDGHPFEIQFIGERLLGVKSDSSWSVFWRTGILAVAHPETGGAPVCSVLILVLVVK